MILWVILGLAILLVWGRVQEGLAMPGVDAKPDATEEATEDTEAKPEENADPVAHDPKDLEPSPENSLPCTEYVEKKKKEQANVDYYYCRGFNNVTCGDVSGRGDRISACPGGYDLKSLLDA